MSGTPRTATLAVAGLLALLSFTAWAEPIGRAIRPSATDPGIEQWNHHHYVYADPDAAFNGKLFVHLAGAFGKPENSQLILREAAALGYLAIGLRYPNSWTLAQLCGKNPPCYEQVRLETIDGEDRTRKIDVDRTNSIENRLVRLLEYLRAALPERNWDLFFDGPGRIDWSRVVLSGHSQGAGHAAMIATHHRLDRVLIFSGFSDGKELKQGIAPWLEKRPRTPYNRFTGFVHEQDGHYDAILGNWAEIGLAPNTVDVDDYSRPYGSRPGLTTSRKPQTGDFADAHGSTVVDGATPLDANGSPVYSPVWQYMMLGY